MSHRSRPATLAVIALVTGLLVAACSGGSCDRPARRQRRRPERHRPRRRLAGRATSSSSSGSATSRASSSPSSTSRQQHGYYADAGLEVEFQNKIDPDLITLVGQGAIDVGIGDGTSVIPAASQGIPVQYVATIYGKFPIDRVRQGVVRDQDRGRPQGQEARDPGQVRLGLDHAPGPARLGEPDPGRPDDRRVPRLRPGRRGRGRARSMPRPASPTTSRSSSS